MSDDPAPIVSAALLEAIEPAAEVLDLLAPRRRERRRLEERVRDATEAAAERLGHHPREAVRSGLAQERGEARERRRRIVIPSWVGHRPPRRAGRERARARPVR